MPGERFYYTRLVFCTPVLNLSRYFLCVYAELSELVIVSPYGLRHLLQRGEPAQRSGLPISGFIS